MGEDSEQITGVEIYHQTYHVRSGGDAAYVRQLASYVNEQMTGISEHTPTVDTLKVAILAALNIADEYFATKRELEALEEKLTQESAKMFALVDPLLERSAP